MCASAESKPPGGPAPSPGRSAREPGYPRRRRLRAPRRDDPAPRPRQDDPSCTASGRGGRRPSRGCTSRRLVERVVARRISRSAATRSPASISTRQASMSTSAPSRPRPRSSSIARPRADSSCARSNEPCIAEQAGEERQQDSLGMTVARCLDLLDHALAALDRFRNWRRAEHGSSRVGGRSARLLPRVTCEAGVLRARAPPPRRRGRSGTRFRVSRREAARPSRVPAWSPALLEDRHRLGDRHRRLVAPALVCDQPSAEREGGRGTRAPPPAVERPRRPSRSPLRGPPPPPRIARLGGAPRRNPEAARAASRSSSTRATARPSRLAAAGTSPRANALRPAEASRREPVRAERTTVRRRAGRAPRDSGVPARGDTRGSPRTRWRLRG